MISLKSLLIILLRVFRRIKNFLKAFNPSLIKQKIRQWKETRRQNLTNELSELIQEEKNIPPEFIWDIIVAEKSLREPALQLFLNHPELSFSNIYEAAVNMPNNENDADYLQNTLWAKLKEIGLSPQDLMDMIMEWPSFFQKKALEELTERIKSKKIRKDPAKRILRTLMEEVSHLRECLCKLYEACNPSSGEWRNLSDAKWLDYMPGLKTYVQRMARETSTKEKVKEKYKAKIGKRIKKILEKLAKTKKGLG